MNESIPTARRPALTLRSARLIAVLALLVVTLTNAATAAPLVSDGTFTTPTSSGDLMFSAGQTFGSWTVVSGNIDLLSTTYWQPPAAGQQTVDMNGIVPGSISQSISTAAGQTYLLTFSLSGNVGATGIDVLGVYFGGTQVGSPSFNTAGYTTSNMGWVSEQFYVQATSSSTLLQFTSLQSAASANGPVLGNVAMTAVPEPSADVLVLSLVLLLASQIRRGRTLEAGR